MKPEVMTGNQEAEEEAIAWIIREDLGLDAAERLAFETWLGANPIHAECHARLRLAWARMDDFRVLAKEPRWAVPAVSPSIPRAIGRKILPWLSVPIAAMLAFALFHGTGEVRIAKLTPSQQPPPVLTESAWLEDGSHAILEPGASVELGYTAGERHLRLLRGCATFQVRKDPSRPFVVEAGRLRFRALGTVFQVREDGEGVELRVSEGRVGIGGIGTDGDEVPVLVAGERTRLSSATKAAELVRVPLGVEEAGSMVDSGEGLLEFDQVPLSEVAAILSARGPYRVRIADEACGRVRVVASLRPGRAPDLAAMLCSYGRLWYRVDGYEIVMGSVPPVPGR